MLNQTVIVGRIVGDLEVKEGDNGTKYTNMTVAVPRSYKNENGEYETDFIDVTLFGKIAENTAEYCKKGDLVGVKGSIKTSTYEDKDNVKRKSTKVVGDKVTFLSTSKVNEKSDEDLEV